MASLRAHSLSLALVALTAHAQLVQPDLRLLTTRDGLSHGMVWCMVKDQREHLWVGTSDGLNRFDGRHFKIYRPDGSPRSIPGRVIFSMALDNTGLIHIATDAPFLTILDPLADTLFNLPLPRDADATTAEEHVHAVIADRAGSIWFSHGTRSLSKLGGDRRIAATFTLPLPARMPADRRGTGHIVMDHDGVFWVAMYKGLVRFDPATGEASAIDIRPRPGTPGEGYAFQVSGVIDEDSTLLIGTFAEGIFRMRKRDGEVVRLWPGPDHVPNYVDHMVGDLLEQEDGSVLVATLDMGVLRMDPISGRMDRFDRSLQPARCREVEPLLTGAWRFMPDGDDLWIGTTVNGLALRPARNNRHRGFALPVADPVLRNEFVLSLARDAATGRWLALTNERGLFVFEGDGSYAGHIAPPAGNGRYRCQHVLATGDGRAWISTDRHLLLADVRTMRLLPLPFEPRTNACSGWIWWSVPDGKGGLWCYDDNDSLHHFDPETGECRELTELFPSVATFLKGPVEAAFVDGNARLWIALRDTLPVVLGPGGEARQLHAPDGIPLHARSFAAAADGSVLAATNGHGVLSIQYAAEGTPVVSHVAGRAHEEVFAVLGTTAGPIWYETTTGLTFFDPSTGRTVTLGTQDGLPSADLRLENTTAPIDGPLLVGIWEGVIAIDPRTLDQGDTPPVVQVPRFFAGDSLIAHSADEHRDAFMLAHERDRVVFELRTTNLVDPQRDLIAYRLTGLDTTWSQLPAQERITFSSLDPGRYELEVKARTNGGRWGGVTRVPFIIRPPLWATWWFRGLLVIALAAAAWVLFRMLLRVRLARQRRQLERERAVLEERVRIAHDLHDDLGSGLASIGMESELAAMEAGDPATRDALRRVSEGARNVGDDMRRIIWAMGSGQETLGDLVAYVRGFAGEMLDQAGVELDFQHERIDPAFKLTVDQRKHLALFCKEALHNVVKHAAASSVSMHFSQAADILHLSITDDGRGFDTGSRLGAGTGTTSMQERAKALHGQVTLESAPGRGSRIALSLPLAPAEF